MLRIPLPLSDTPCPACGTYVPQAGRVCPVCGYVYPIIRSDDVSSQPLTEADWQALLARIDQAEAEDDPDA
jgi:uncharacterized Zn finger protein (UPF0148 family)